MSQTEAIPDRVEQTPKQRGIADAATRLFMAQGYADVSMDAIARAAGVSKATLYAYFASKERLFASLVGDACRVSGPASVELSDGEADVRATLATLADRTLHFMFQERSLAIYRVVIAEAARFPELGSAFYERGPAISRRNLTVWLQRQMAAGRLRQADSEIAAEQFMGLLRTHLQMRALLGVGPPPTEAEIQTTAQAAVDTFMRAYAPA